VLFINGINAFLGRKALIPFSVYPIVVSQSPYWHPLLVSILRFMSQKAKWNQIKSFDAERMMNPTLMPPMIANGTREMGLALVQKELRVVQLLFEISQALNKSLNLEELMPTILKMMSEHAGLMRGTITLLNRDTGDIEIDSAYGLSNEERTRGHYRLGEGVTGKVIETATPAIVEKISQEPRFLDKTGARIRDISRNKRDISFICVPIHGSNGTIGALSVDRLFSEDSSLDEDVRLLTVIAALLAQAVEIRQEVRQRERELQEEKERLQGEILDHFKPMNIVGTSHAIQQVYRLINQVAPSRARVLITGESGVGKELVAEAVHMNSPRAEKPFIKVNLAALPESTIESELFGHERGAFTGAISMRKGRFEMADGGTLFLDEIGDLPMATQIKLLRVLQEKEFERLGGVNTIKVDVRVISATNRNIEELVKNQQFRLDLYYRLNIFPIFVPPLRERKTDIVLLADHFIERANKKNGKNIRRISTPAIDMMMSYHWPGNIRELENCMERAVILSTDGVIHGHHLPPSLQTAEASNTPPQGNLPASLAAFENEMIVDALKSARGNAARAARFLGVSERYMRLHIAKYGIDAKRFKQSSLPA
jgi:Nif-specific regulatory protein